jgi:phosphate starvation-inducible PhoH-like protein
LNEKIIKIKNIDPKELFGLRNKNIDFIKSSFPKLKIITRGDEIKVFGDDKLLLEFESKIQIIFNYYLEYNSISENEIKALIKSDSISDVKTSKKSHGAILHGVGGKPIKAKTINQRKIVDSIINNDMVFAIGPAGTGKTYTGVALAVKALKDREVKRIILTRPAIEAGENLGFLPGDLKEKLDPYMQPIYDALFDMLPIDKLNEYLEDGTIQISPLAFMRGRTLDKAFVILDEGQNTTEHQMKMFLTRMGKSAKFIITGDITQIDLPKRTISGLISCSKILNKINGIKFIHLDEKDVVRHKIQQNIK